MGRKVVNSILTALLLIGLATLILLCAFGVISSKDIFFDGWWVIFIVIPMFYGAVNSLFTKDILSVISSVIFAGDIIFFFVAKFVMGWQWGKTLAVFGAVLLISIALKVIFSPFTHRKRSGSDGGGVNFSYSSDGSGDNEVKFGEKEFSYAGQDFTGTELNVAFGASKLDLSTANIVSGSEIKLDVSFGGAEIIIPDGIYVENRCSAFCGGVSVKQNTAPSSGAATLILTGKCNFGGVDVKRSSL